MKNPDLIVRPMTSTETDLTLFMDCFERNGSPKERAFLQWQFIENPADEFKVNFVVDDQREDKRLAAIYASMPVRFKVGDQVVAAAQSLNTLTDIDYRGQGLFVDTAQSVFSRCENEDVALIYGFPNGRSAHGFFNRLGWTHLDSVPILFKPLRSRLFLKKMKIPGFIADRAPNIPLTRHRRRELPSGFSLRSGLEFDEQFDRLWDRFSQNITVAVQRDEDYLRWRFEEKMQKVGANYQMLSLYRDEQLCGFIVYCSREKHGGQIGYIMEFLYDSEYASPAKIMLRHAIADLYDQGCDLALAWNFSHSPSYGPYRRCGFMPMPERLRPIELHVGVRPLATEQSEMILERENWYISYCDSDTV